MQTAINHQQLDFFSTVLPPVGGFKVGQRVLTRSSLAATIVEFDGDQARIEWEKANRLYFGWVLLTAIIPFE
jgi:hypothetical protein